MLEILLFLFQNYLEKSVKGEENLEPDQLAAQLKDAGFDAQEIHQAFNWLEHLTPAEASEGLKSSIAIRCFNYDERYKLTPAARGFLLFLEQSNVIDPVNRELVIDRAMAINMDSISIEQIQWIVLMVLFKQPEQKSALAWVENYVLESISTTIH